MRTLIIIVVLLIGIQSSTNVLSQTNPAYDAELAQKLGADEFGMKSYFFVLLKTGSVVIENKSIRDSLFAGHLRNIGRLADEGKLVLAGPLGKNQHQYRGLFILSCKSMAQADSILLTDPAVAAKLLEAEVFNWYGSAALPSYLEVHKKIEKRRP